MNPDAFCQTCASSVLSTSLLLLLLLFKCIFMCVFFKWFFLRVYGFSSVVFVFACVSVGLVGF